MSHTTDGGYMSEESSIGPADESPVTSELDGSLSSRATSTSSQGRPPVPPSVGSVSVTSDGSSISVITDPNLGSQVLDFDRENDEVFEEEHNQEPEGERKKDPAEEHREKLDKEPQEKAKEEPEKNYKEEPEQEHKEDPEEKYIEEPEEQYTEEPEEEPHGLVFDFDHFAYEEQPDKEVKAHCKEEPASLFFDFEYFARDKEPEKELKEQCKGKPKKEAEEPKTEPEKEPEGLVKSETTMDYNAGVRKEVLKSILRFLRNEIVDPKLDCEQKEAIAVAKQCLEVTYEMDDDCLHDATDLVELFKKMKISMEFLNEDEMREEADKEKCLGNDCMRDNDFEGALEHYNRAIRINNKEAIYYGNRAAAYSRLNRNRDAILDCKEAIKLDPGYGKAYGRLGIAYSNLAMYSEAAEAYRKALELDPTNASYEANLKLAVEKIAPGGTPAGPGGAGPSAFDFGAFMNNPALLNMASQMLSDPSFRNMVSGIMTSGPAGEPSLDSFVEVGHQLAEHMQATNPVVMEQLRQTFQPLADGEEEDAAGENAAPDDNSNEQKKTE